MGRHGLGEGRTKGGREKVRGSREGGGREVMFPLLSPLPVLIPKWRDCKNDIPPAVSVVSPPPPAPSPPPPTHYQHTHTHQRNPKQPPAVSYRGDERKKQGAEKYFPSGL
ncbi:uncharacterized protein ACO6RY_19932 [Pungitius sinensis]